MKKTVSLMVALVMLLGMVMVMPVSAETPVIEENIPNSITEEVDTGFGLAFAVTVNATGVGVKNGNYFDNTNAQVVHNGETVKLVKMGVVLTNRDSVGQDSDQLVLENVNSLTILNIEALRLFDLEEDYCSFAVRVTNIPKNMREVNLYARPYYVIEAEGSQETMYGTTTDCASYLDVWGKYQDEIELPAIGTDIDVSKKENRIRVSAASYGYKLDDAGEEILVGVDLTFKNYTTNLRTEETNWVEYTYYDAGGNALGTGVINVGIIGRSDGRNAEKTYSVSVPLDAVSVELTDSSVTYVPDIELPAIGTDIDVSKQKNRIRVSAASADITEDDTIKVSLTFQNYTTNWITEETDYVKYTYYDADGKSLGTGTIYIGCIDTKKNKVKTFTFEVPAAAAKVALTSSKITYWTEWA